MKKLLLPLLIFTLLFSSCQNKIVVTSNTIDVTDIDSIVIEVLPSPPKMKTIDKKEDIEKIINYINSISKEKMKQENLKGWVVYIHTKGKKEHSISFVGDKIYIDNVWYKINTYEAEKVKNLYDNLNYKEESV